ncbi:hypothetical protein LSAT2_015105 [Lamellibrachia satsuma]|nr:hypothetical protein LSAT2_015105 [Lamellibrachia satsuma]
MSIASAQYYPRVLEIISRPRHERKLHELFALVSWFRNKSKVLADLPTDRVERGLTRWLSIPSEYLSSRPVTTTRTVSPNNQRHLSRGISTSFLIVDCEKSRAICIIAGRPQDAYRPVSARRALYRQAG